ncbi:ATP-binding protein [Sphingomonas sp. CJ20]
MIGALRARLAARTRRRPHIARQLAMVLVAIVVLNGALVFAAMAVWTGFAEQQLKRSASPAALQAIIAVEAGRVPSLDGIEDVIRETNAITRTMDQRVKEALVICLIITAAGDFVLGSILLRKLGRGLNDVAATARRVAGGDLSARAPLVAWASAEEAQLIDDFNGMAQSLERAERELAESTAAIAHELRTPLTILYGRLQGTINGVFDCGPVEMQLLLLQVEGLRRLVDDLQTINLANSHRMILDPAHTDLAIEVERVVALMSPDLEGAGIAPHPQLSHAPVVADGARVRQVIGAILSNAQRYAAGSGPLVIATERQDDWAVLVIRDHGPGLPDGGAEAAFDRFWRGESSRARASGGTGLGLSVVRAIAEAHAGTATLENAPGGGTRFTMRLPVRPRVSGT